MTTLGPPAHVAIYDDATLNPFSFHTLRTQDTFTNPKNDESECPPFNDLSMPHINSFNAIFQMPGLAAWWEVFCRKRGKHIGYLPQGILDLAIKDVEPIIIHDGLFHPVQMQLPEQVGLQKLGKRLQVWIENVSVGKPALQTKQAVTLYPTECRQRGTSYKAPIQATICYNVVDTSNGQTVVQTQTLLKDCGMLPVMVRSVKCNLNGLNVKERMEKGEEALDLGGYFITNGIERLIRLLIAPRRNYPLALSRPSFQKRGAKYTSFGVQIRSVRMDQSSMTTTLHYLDDGSCTWRFAWRKQEYIVPVMLILRALTGASDKEIYERIVSNGQADTWVTDRIELLLRSMKDVGLYTREQARAYIGSKFAVMLDSREDWTDEQVGTNFLHQCVLVHLDDNQAKFDLMMYD
jgi:DNA-directed RNA polymerase I subunit RPA2